MSAAKPERARFRTSGAAPIVAAMRYVLVGLGFGAVWAVIQLLRGEVTAPLQLAVPVVLCGAFGGFLWGLRIVVLHLARRFRSARRPHSGPSSPRA